MRMYPAYKLRETLDEYAIVFFTLLNEGYKAKARENLVLATIRQLPHMTAEARTEFLNRLQWAASEPDDILRPSTGKASSPDEIRKVLGG